MKNFFKKIVVFIIQLEARVILKKYSPKIIVVTGSVGKTTTKDMVHTVISSSYFTRKSSKSFNSEIGIPLTILGCENGWNNILKWSKNILEGLKLLISKNHYPNWLVLEVGADQPGDIKSIAKWLKPDIVILTKIPRIPVHIEFFKSVEELAEEKFSMARALKKGGFLILNEDDKRIKNLAQKNNMSYLTYGFGEKAEFKAEEEKQIYERGVLSGILFKVNYQGNVIPIKIDGVLGKPFILSALAGIATGISQGINMVDIEKSFKNYKPLPGRMRIIKGKKKSVLIDDSYNSSPEALKVAINTLKLIETSGRKIAILGDMLELGNYSTEAHKEIGLLCAQGVDILATVGIRADDIAKESIFKGMDKNKVFNFDTSESAKEWASELVENGDVILVKGSQSLRMEKITEEIMKHPEMKEELLPRQGEEWQKR